MAVLLTRSERTVIFYLWKKMSVVLVKLIIKRERSKTSLPIFLFYSFIKRKLYYLAQPKEHLTALAQPAQISSL